MELSGRIALVTGAAQGIGWAVARKLSEAGATLALLDLDGDGVRRAEAMLSSAHAYPCDVSDPEQVGDAMDQIQESLGPIEILVNNAGIWRHTPVLETTEMEWDEVFAVNVKGILFCAQTVAPGMIERRCGKIVNIASVAGFGGNPDWSAYCASKAAAISLTLALAEELAKHNVQVNTVCPGATQTALLESIYQTESGWRTDWVHQPEEVAEEVLDLLVPFAQNTTGQVVAMKPADKILGIPVRPPV